MFRPLFVLFFTLVLCGYHLARADKRTCFCEISKGRDTFSPRLLDVNDPVMRGSYLSCRKMALWCPSICYKAAKRRLINGGRGDVSPLKGSAGDTACNICMQNITSSTEPQMHLYATYRVSNCGLTGFRYLGRLCCWQYSVGDEQLYLFNEGCQCGPKPGCDVTSSTTAATTTPDTMTDTSTITTTIPAPTQNVIV